MNWYAQKDDEMLDKYSEFSDLTESASDLIETDSSKSETEDIALPSDWSTVGRKRQSLSCSRYSDVNFIVKNKENLIEFFLKEFFRRWDFWIYGHKKDSFGSL